ncbi:GntR family transcriptional regulator [Bombilactobacillus folatiphilus]|uniref:GntR family transcriptional regulator n=1 Tax=Bombilactobacillus folatiphilus TaxID=2923362 RepID=A0ABY4P9U3_9LACO|nr:GntR family transcriptional regulator [Bombilactobacillus folatiphilus]UQS82474.1 GntR family transcriptional regulator [Bombilactobacillus folatiphilus]
MSRYLYQSAKKDLLNLIADGTFLPNSKIWNERKLATTLGYTRSTIKNAIDALVEDNILQKYPGDGTYLVQLSAEDPLRIGDNAPNSFTQLMRVNKKSLTSHVESFQALYRNTELADLFHNGAQDFYELVRTRFVAQNPLALQKAYIPFKKFPDAHRYDFSQLSLYDYMDFKNKKPIQFKTKIRAFKLVDAQVQLSQLFSPTDYAYLLYFEYWGYTNKHELVEYTQSWYNPEFVNYKITTKR